MPPEGTIASRNAVGSNFCLQLVSYFAAPPYISSRIWVLAACKGRVPSCSGHILGYLQTLRALSGGKAMSFLGEESFWVICRP